jgi:NAD(P)-dependent dehydrogenase (short-subunit alcohol dehydrogenase family)
MQDKSDRKADYAKAFVGKVVFVAGGSSGINLSIAQSFARAGAKVALISRSQEKITAAAKTITDEGHEALGVVADVRDYQAVEDALRLTVSRFGQIDVVVSGAAGNFVAAALDMSANGFKTIIDIDLIGTFNVFRASYEFLARPGASLIAITGQAPRPTMYQAHVCAAKAGINMLTQCLAMEWGPAGVRVNAIAPGMIGDTEGMRRLAPSEAENQLNTGTIALRTYGAKDDIAEAALFLSSDSARYITGAILFVDGGLFLGNSSTDARPGIG